MSSSIPPPPRGSPDSSERSRSDEIAADAERAPDGPSGKGRRPRYLAVALVGALVFGAGCWTEGCGRLAYYRGEHDRSAMIHASIRDEGDRTHAESLYQRFVEAAEASRGRAIPLAAATFVLGAALLALAARGLAGRSNTRSALMQVVAAQAIVVCISYYATRDIRNAELDWEFERSLIERRETMPADKYRELASSAQVMRRWLPPGWLVVRSIASALILLALSRPRAREFFEAAARPVPDP